MRLLDRMIGAARRARLLARPVAAPPAPPEGVDPMHPQVLHDPYPYYAALLEKGPVHFLPGQDFWVVLGYDEVLRAFKDHAHFPSARAQARFDPVLNETDPPEHTRVRRAVAPYFAPGAIDALEPLARQVATGLLRENAGRAEVDLVGDFAVPYVERVAGGFLGLTPDECESLRARLAPYGDDAQMERFAQLYAWSAERIEAAACAPGAGLAGRLFGDGAALTAAEAAGLLKLFWVASITTTARLVAAAFLHLLRDPALREALRADPARIPALVEEAARMDPPEFLIWRTAGEGAEIGGVAIPAGAEVRLCLGAANRDPSRFRDPHLLVLGRAPNPHLTFGSGPHVCPGSRLARLQVRVAVETLLAEWPELRESRPLTALTYVPSPSYRALEALHVSPAGSAR